MSPRGFRDEDDGDAFVTIDNVKCIAVTKAAILCVVPDHGEQWIPQSQVSDDSEVFALGNTGKLVVTGWFARKSGLGP
jgi:hypothetical protein